MKKLMRKLLSIAVSACLVLTCTTTTAFAQASSVGITYQAHVQNIGWQTSVSDGQAAGTSGSGLRLEALKINLTNAPADSKICYQTHVQNLGWLPTVSNGEIGGTTGQSLRAEAFKIYLENLPGYSVEYRVHVQDIGWMGWVKDGAEAGTTGRSLRVEAVQIRIIAVDSTVTVTPSAITLIAGGTTGIIKASDSSTNSSDKLNTNFTWSTSDARVATVNGGIVTPLAEGTAVITAASSKTGMTASSIVTVVSGISYQPQSLVSFNSNGGSSVNSLTVPCGGTLKLPANPTKAGYNFGGWFTDNNIFTDAFTGTTPVAQSLTVYAKWNVISYTVSFNSNGGSPVTSIIQDYGTALTAPAAPTKSGFAFAGWNPLLPATMPVNGAALGAQWNPKSLSVAAQDGAITAKTSSQSASCAITTANVSDAEIVTVSLYAADGITAASVPEGLTASALPVSTNTSAVSITADNTSMAGTYYFRAVIDGVKSNLVTVTISKANPVIQTYPAPGSIVYGSVLAKSDLIGGVAVHDGNMVSGIFTLVDADYMPSAGLYSAKLKFTPTDSANFNTLSGSSIQDVTVSVTLRPITITAASSSKVYNGSVLYSSGYSITSGSLVIGQQSFGTTTGSQLFVGSSANRLNSFGIIDADNNDVTKNYKVTAVDGNLTVTRASIDLTVTADSAVKVYDGTALTDSGYTFTGTLAAGDTVTAITAGGQTSVGTGTNLISSVKVMHDGTDVTENYTINTTDGTLQVTSRPITIKANDEVRVYDGTALTGGAAVVGGSLADNQTLSACTTVGSQTNVGSTANTASAAIIRDSMYADVTSNYSITYRTGTLEVTSRPVTITADSSSKVYDGTALTYSSASVTAGSLAANQILYSAVVTGSRTNAGSSVNSVSGALIRDGSNNDVTSNYTISYTTGTLTITARPITITAASNQKVYDGLPLAIHNSELNAGTPLAAGEILFTVTTAGSQTNVGSSANTPSGAIVKRGETDVTSNYAITYTSGMLTVTARPITILARSSTLTYDGSVQSVSGWDLTSGSMALSQIFSTTAGASGTNAGFYTTSFSNAKVLAGTTDVTSNYSITLLDGALTINQLPIQIIAYSDSKIYDATVLVNHTSELSGSTPLASGDILYSVTTTGSRIDAGSSNNTPSGAVIMRDETDVTVNYAITYTPGTLTVMQRPITVTAGSDVKTYDGTTSSTGQPTITSGTLVSGQIGNWTQNFTSSTAGTNINILPGGTIWNNGVNVTGNYSITFSYGKGTIYQRSITLTAVTDTKTYDGNTSSVGQPTLTAGSLVSGQTGNWTQSFATSAAGTNINLIPSGTIWNGGQDVTGSYSIGTVYSAGTINAAPSNIISVNGNTITVGSINGAIVSSARFIVTSLNQSHSSQTDVYTLKAYDNSTGTWVTLQQNPPSYSLMGNTLTIAYDYDGVHPYSLIEFFFFNQDGCLSGYQSTIEYTANF